MFRFGNIVAILISIVCSCALIFFSYDIDVSNPPDIQIDTQNIADIDSFISEMNAGGGQLEQTYIKELSPEVAEFLGLDSKSFGYRLKIENLNQSSIMTIKDILDKYGVNLSGDAQNWFRMVSTSKNLFWVGVASLVVILGYTLISIIVKIISFPVANI